MSKRTIEHIQRLISWGIQASLGVSGASIVVLASSAVAMGQDPIAMAGAAKAVSEALPTDLVRLVLVSGVVSQLVAWSLVFAAFRVAQKWGQKPCLLDAAPAKAVVREFLRDGAHRPTPQED